MLRPVSCPQSSTGSRSISTSGLRDQTMACILCISCYYCCDKSDPIIVKLLYISLLTRVILYSDAPSLVPQETTTHHILVSIPRIVWICRLVRNRSCYASTYKYQVLYHQIWSGHQWMEQWHRLASRDYQLDVLLQCQRWSDPYRRRNAITGSSTATNHVS